MPLSSRCPPDFIRSRWVLRLAAQRAVTQSRLLSGLVEGSPADLQVSSDGVQRACGQVPISMPRYCGSAAVGWVYPDFVGSSCLAVEQASQLGELPVCHTETVILPWLPGEGLTPGGRPSPRSFQSDPTATAATGVGSVTGTRSTPRSTATSAEPTTLRLYLNPPAWPASENLRTPWSSPQAETAIDKD